MFKNLSNLEFMIASEKRLMGIYTAYLDKYQQLVGQLTSAVNADEFEKIRKARDGAEAGFLRSKEAYRQIRILSAIRHYQDSPFGVMMKRKDGREYRTVYKTNDVDDIQCWLFDWINSDHPTDKIFENITARNYIRYCDDYGHRNASDFIKRIYKEAIRVRSEELDTYRYKFGWVNQVGLSVYNKNMSWLFVKETDVSKLKTVLSFDDGRIVFNQYIGEWNGVNFAINTDFSEHKVPKSWVMGVSGQIYPLKYARRRNLKIRGAIPNSPAMIILGRVGDVGTAFSHRFGYYNSNEHTSYKGKLYSRNELVVIADGTKIPTEEARYVDRYSAYFKKDECVKLNDGTYELRRDCISYNNRWYHQSTTEFRVCGLCGNTHPTQSFRRLLESDPESTEVCEYCHSSASREISRMCYSTDVINHKGFGTTNLKINGEGVFVGLELETYADFNDQNRHEVSAKLNGFVAHKENTYTVATRDGSLSSTHGIEYIFRPEGLLNQKRNVNHFIQKTNGLLAEDAGDGYGLHIHVSDHFLNQIDKVRIDNFISMYEKYFRTIGGRGDTEYQHKKEITGNHKLKEFSHGKYKMVNIGRSGTIEYRFPKSLVNEVHISMNLELALAVTMYCKYHLSSIKLDTRSGDPAALKGFIDYVSSNKKTYPLLHAENTATIKLDKLEKYSEFCKKALRAKKEQLVHDESYTLAA